MTADPREYVTAGAILVRKNPAHDEFDRLRVEGFQSFAIEGGCEAIEVVVRPAGSFAPALHVDVEALGAAYEVATKGAPPKAFETDPLDVLLRRDSTLHGLGDATRILQEARQSDDRTSPRVDASRTENATPKDER